MALESRFAQVPGRPTSRRDRAGGPLLSFVVSLVLPGLAAACSEVVGPGGRGEVSFRYSGALEGRLDVAAAGPTFSIEGVPTFGDWTLAAAGQPLGGALVSGFRLSAPDRGDMFLLRLDELRTGELTCGPSRPCHGRLLFGIPDHGGLPPSAAERHFEITSGTVVVEDASGGRLRGTFSLTARDHGGTGTETLSVTDGRFDVPRGMPSHGLSVICTAARAAGESCG